MTCHQEAMTADLIFDTLERASEKCADPAPLVYRRLFELRPEFEALFVMDTDGGVRGSMLETCFNAILGIVEGSSTQRVIISSSRFSHGGYGVGEADFELMFRAIRDTFRDLLGGEWTPAMEAAWTGLLAEISTIE